jgi:hypothetical protein
MSTLRTRVPAGLAVIALLAAGCGGSGVTQHPLTNTLDPAFQPVQAKTLAALPFHSDISEQDDPDRVAASMVESKFYRALTAAPTGYTLLSSSEVGRSLESKELTDDLANFYRDWTNDQEDVDADFIKQVASHMNADAVVAGVVDVWAQHPVDITQSGTARTDVGVMIGLFDGASGRRIWLGRDENFKEALRYTAGSETGDVARVRTEREMERTNLRTAGGVYAPPDFDGVVDVVVMPLVQAFPKRP